MKKFYVNYCDRGNTSLLHSTDTLEEAINLANGEVKCCEQIGEDVDPDTNVADIFHIEVWSYDEASESDPELEYATDYYCCR